MSGYTESSLRAASRDGRATPDGRLPITDQDDLRRALLATARADEEMAASLITHCARRGREMGPYTTDDLAAMVAASGVARRVGSLLKRVWDPSKHPRGADGRFIEVGAQVHWNDRRTGTLQGGRVTAINTDGTVKVATHGGETVDLTPHMLRTVEVKTRVPTEDRPQQPLTDTARPITETETEPESPQAVITSRRPVRGRDPVGDPAQFSDADLDLVRAAIGQSLSKLPDDPMDIHLGEPETIEDNEFYKDYRDRASEHHQARDRMEAAKVALETKLQEGAALPEFGTPADYGLTQEQWGSLNEHHRWLYGTNLQARHGYDDPSEEPLDARSLIMFLSQGIKTATDRAHTAERHMQDQVDALERRRQQGLDRSARMDKKDRGPDAILMGMLNDVTAAGRAVDDLVERILEREGFAADALDSEFAMSEHVKRTEELTGLRHALFKKHLRGKMDETMLAVADKIAADRNKNKPLGEQPVTPEEILEWLLDPDSPWTPFDLAYHAMEAEGIPYTIGAVNNRLEQMWAFVPAGTRRDMDRALVALNTSAPSPDGRRRYSERRAQVNRQVLMALGVEFGVPDDMEWPYICLASPAGSDSAWKNVAGGAPKPPQNKPVTVGQTVYFGSQSMGRGIQETTKKWTVVELVKDPNYGPVPLIRMVDENGTENTVRASLVKVEVPLTEANLRNLQEALALMPTAVIRSIWKDQPQIRVTQSARNNRASRGRAHLNLGVGTAVRTMVHEEHHGWENSAPWVRSLEWALLADRGYEGEIGSRRPKPGTKGRPKRYQASRLQSSTKNSAYRDSEIAIEDDFTEPYMGKIYHGGWDDYMLGGEWANTANYELATMTSESVLTGGSYFREDRVGMWGRWGEEENARMAAEAVQRNEGLRGQHAWYIGMVMYAALGNAGPTGGGQTPPETSSDLGRQVGAMSTIPARLKSLRDRAHSSRGVTDVYRKDLPDGRVEWTMVVREPGDPTGRNGTVQTTWNIGDSGGASRHVRSVLVGPDGSVRPIGRDEVSDAIERLRKDQMRRRAAAVRRGQGVFSGAVPETLETPELAELAEESMQANARNNDRRKREGLEL